MKASIFGSLDPQKAIDEAVRAEQKAAFFANGGKIKAEPIRQASAEVPRYNGKNHSDIGTPYVGEEV